MPGAGYGQRVVFPGNGGDESNGRWMREIERGLMKVSIICPSEEYLFSRGYLLGF